MVNQLTTFNDEAQSTCVQLANNLDWQSPVMAAPCCIVLIAHCMALSVNTDDVSLQACRPTNGFKYLEQPKSLRACLRQVSNATYDAMATAQVKMGAVALASGGIPTHIRTMYEALTLYAPHEMERVMPREADIVRREAAKCVEWSKDVELKFQTTKNLLDELLGCCEEKRGQSEHDARRKEQQKKKWTESLALAEKNLRDQEVEIRANLAERKQLQRDVQQLGEYTMGEKIAGALRQAADIGGEFCRRIVGLPSQDEGTVPRVASPVQRPHVVDVLASFPLPDMQSLDQMYGRLLACQLDSPTLPDLATTVASILGAFPTIAIFVDLNEYPTSLANYFATIEMNQSAQEARLVQLQRAATTFHQQFKTMVRTSEAVRTRSTEAAREVKKRRDMAEDRRSKYELASRILERARIDKSLIEQRIADTKTRQDLIVQTLTDIRVDSATIDDAIKLLKLVIGHLTHLCEEWSKMTIFFEGISVIMAQAGADVHDTTKSIEDGADNVGMSPAFKESILRACVLAHGRAKLINLTSSVYVDVSKAYFLDDLNTLNRIMQLTPREAKLEVERREKRLAQTHSGIGALVTRKHCQMVAFMEQHAQNGRQEYLAIAAAPSEKREFERQASDVEEKAKSDAQTDAIQLKARENALNQARCAFEGDAF
ncbi:Aste57867_2831 [Aphanomyces stellatus]|uniref:Aste57867_2831 protein n=1 Tax=Aphanomyces stellatus TaxID=120398 RepID=A0A485KE32_9STRA|nr:hypothetical protein As57867_002824 [Aphanomyces stellatus]VFT80019.1 Aste57867_2831 [Aphanomyces stellatus]